QAAAGGMAGQLLQRQMDAGRVLVALARAHHLGHAAAPAFAAALAFSRSAACSAVTRSHADVSLSDWSTGFCTLRMASPFTICRHPSHAFTQTQGMSGSTSQLPLARTPPQGPLRSCFGQFIGHDMPVDESTHWPHMRQSNMKPFTRFSTNFTGPST